MKWKKNINHNFLLLHVANGSIFYLVGTKVLHKWQLVHKKLYYIIFFIMLV